MNTSTSTSRIALIASVGTTAAPLIKAVDEAIADGELSVFFVYGRPFPGQSPDPLDVVAEIKGIAKKKGANVQTFEIADPEDLDSCLKVFRHVFELVTKSSPDRTIVDFTGGTKAMSAALVHAALTTVPDNLTLEYVGGSLRNNSGRVEVMEKKHYPTASEECTRRILGLVKDFNYTQALVLCQSLPQTAKAVFLSKSVKGLWLWDNFHYEEAFEELKNLKEAQFLVEDPYYSGLAKTVLRLTENGWKMKQCINSLADLESNKRRAGDATNALGNDLLYSVADFLENATRRLTERRFVDTVLRSYRAMEAAIQASLIRLKINPWHPEWSNVPKQKVEDYLRATAKVKPPDELSLFSGFILIETLTKPFASETKEALQKLSFARNHSHLEHGYTNIKEKSAREHLTSAESLCQHILLHAGFAENLLHDYRLRLAHQFQ
jgi:CRISPR-associated protein (TIGR02710 family)